MGGANHTHNAWLRTLIEEANIIPHRDDVQFHAGPDASHEASATDLSQVEIPLASERRDPSSRVARQAVRGSPRQELEAESAARWAELEHPRQADAGRGRSFDLGAALRPGRRRHQDTTIPDAAWPSVVVVAGGPSPSAADVVDDALA